MGFGLETGFIDHFKTRLMTTLNYSAIADLHTSQITTAHAKSFQSAVSSPVFPGNGFKQWRFFSFHPHFIARWLSTALTKPSLQRLPYSSLPSLQLSLHLSSLSHLGMDCVENTASNSSSIVALDSLPWQSVCL
jgi:hypothetical protein